MALHSTPYPRPDYSRFHKVGIWAWEDLSWLSLVGGWSYSNFLVSTAYSVYSSCDPRTSKQPTFKVAGVWSLEKLPERSSPSRRALNKSVYFSSKAMSQARRRRPQSQNSAGLLRPPGLASDPAHRRGQSELPLPSVVSIIPLCRHTHIYIYIVSEQTNKQTAKVQVAPKLHKLP